MSNSPLYTLLERNRDRFLNKKLVIAGAFFDSDLLLLAKDTAACSIIVDDFVTANAMASMVSVSLDRKTEQKFSYKHVDIYFDDIDEMAPNLEEFDALILALSKSKQENLRILDALKAKMSPNCQIYTAGANDGGGKSADSYLKDIGEVYKLDSARKSTLFCCSYSKDFHLYSALPSISVKLPSSELHLKQLPGVFSNGKADEGSLLLLEALRTQHLAGRVLDLGCGCGLIGIALAKTGLDDIVMTDSSAKALRLAQENVGLNGLTQSCRVMASDMLHDLDRFDAIVTNPPFHQGLSNTTAATVNMIAAAPSHLTPGGSLYLVGNAHLGYGKYLKAAFASVEIIAKNSRFNVYKAS